MKTSKIVTEESVEPNNHPNVLAYRVGQLEKTVNEGFITLHSKLDTLRDGFVSHEQMAEAIKQSDIVHADFERRISKLEGWNSWGAKIVLGTVFLAILGLVIKGNI
jgi:hypothetical protein